MAHSLNAMEPNFLTPPPPPLQLPPPPPAPFLSIIDKYDVIMMNDFLILTLGEMMPVQKLCHSARDSFHPIYSCNLNFAVYLTHSYC